MLSASVATGPRSWTLLEGQRREALDAILDVADVVLMTQVACAMLFWTMPHCHTGPCCS